MSKLTCAIVAAGAVLLSPLATDTATALITGPPPTTTGDGTPDCSGAAAMTGVIWPPNHQMVAETIVGVIDPSGLPITISVTGIQQDEPVNALGSGNTAPDGAGVGTSTAYVRAERAGPGTGRIYFIWLSATNTMGLSCTGMVPVFVPHDQGQGFIPTDTGQRFDSTIVPVS